MGGHVQMGQCPGTLPHPKHSQWINFHKFSSKGQLRTGGWLLRAESRRNSHNQESQEACKKTGLQDPRPLGRSLFQATQLKQGVKPSWTFYSVFAIFLHS